METKRDDFKIRITAKDDCKILSFVYNGIEYRIDQAHGANAMSYLNIAFSNFMYGWNMSRILQGMEPVENAYNLKKFIKEQATDKTAKQH